jgi:predicted ribosome quality control (RQC) complex YloA/Tae2 family protein
MPVNYHFLKHLAPALDKRFAGFEVAAVFSQDKDELVLGFARPDQEVYLRCPVTPQFSCLYVSDVFGRARKNSVDLWPEITGLKVLSVAVFENERALRFNLEGDYTLVFKFFGNRPNIILFQGQDAVALFNNQLATDMDLKPDKLNRHSDFSLESFKKVNAQPEKLFYTFGKLIHQEVKQRFKTGNAETDEQKWEIIQQVLRELEHPSYYIATVDHKPVLSLFPVGIPEKTFDEPIEALNYFYIFYQKTISLATEKTSLLNQLLKEKRQTEAYLKDSYERLDKLQNAVKNEELGHILMANLQNIDPETEKVTLHDFYRDQEIEIKLKKELSAQKNAEQYYRKAKNEKIEWDKAEENILLKEERLLKIEEAIAKISETENIRDLRALSKSNEQESAKSSKTEVSFPFKRFVEDGFEILVGKNAKNNDVLTQQYAHKEDLWLHARDCAGSHVIIKNQSGKKIPEHVIEKAGGLAAWFSKRKNEQFVPVIVTPKKFVRKAKGLPDGQVIVEKETVVMAEPFNPGNTGQ